VTFLYAGVSSKPQDFYCFRLLFYMRLLKNYDICLQMSHEEKMQLLQRKLDQTTAYLSVCHGLVKKKNGTAALKEALQQAGECVQSFQPVMQDLQRIHVAQSKSLKAANCGTVHAFAPPFQKSPPANVAVNDSVEQAVACLESTEPVMEDLRCLQNLTRLA